MVQSGFRIDKIAIQFFLLLLPAFVLYSVFMVYPVFGGIAYSLTSWDGISRQAPWVGLKNYQDFLSDIILMRPLINTFVYAFVLTIAQNIASLLMAVALNRKMRSRGILRTLSGLYRWFLVPLW